MATIREYFDTDATGLTVHTDWTFSNANADKNTIIIAKIALDTEANAKYWYLYLPFTEDLVAHLSLIIHSPFVKNCELGPDAPSTIAEFGLHNYSERLSSATLQFTKRIHLYIDTELTPEIRNSLVSQFLSMGFFLSIRDREYANRRSEAEKPLAFISHDSRDKDSFVRELALELAKINCAVWYDEYSLKVGDSLRENIERGLRETRKCIVILSSNFLSNDGWGKAEFDSVFTREIIEKKNVILPVWLDVKVQDVYNYSPRLADKVSLQSTLGTAEVARKLANAIKN